MSCPIHWLSGIPQKEATEKPTLCGCYFPIANQPTNPWWSFRCVCWTPRLGLWSTFLMAFLLRWSIQEHLSVVETVETPLFLLRSWFRCMFRLICGIMWICIKFQIILYYTLYVCIIIYNMYVTYAMWCEAQSSTCRLRPRGVKYGGGTSWLDGEIFNR